MNNTRLGCTSDVKVKHEIDQDKLNRECHSRHLHAACVMTSGSLHQTRAALLAHIPIMPSVSATLSHCLSITSQEPCSVYYEFKINLLFRCKKMPTGLQAQAWIRSAWRLCCGIQPQVAQHLALHPERLPHCQHDWGQTQGEPWQPVLAALLAGSGPLCTHP